MKGFIKITTDKGVALINTSKIRTVRPLENGAEITLEDPTVPISYHGLVTPVATNFKHEFKFGFRNRIISTLEDFDTVLLMIEQAQ